MPSLSVAIITQNEEKNIERCLKSITWANEIIIVDSGSQDKTLEICKKYTKKIYSIPWNGYSLQKQRALDRAECEWLLSLDADEEISEALQEEIKKTLKNPRYKTYKMPRKLVFLGRILKYSEGRSQKFRLFKKGTAKMDTKKVHESLNTKERIGSLKAPIYHHSFHSMNDLIKKMNHYSTLSAEEKKENKQKGGILKGISHGLWTFLKIYFLQKAFLDGSLGFVFAFVLAESSYYRYVKLRFL